MKIKKRRKGSSSHILKRKKAMHPATMIFYYTACFLFAGFVIYTYIKIAYTGAKSTKFNMEYYVNDIGLMTEAIYAVPGDVEYDYRKDPSKFVLDFRKVGFFVYTLTESVMEKMRIGELGEIPVEITAGEDIADISAEILWSNYIYMFKTGNPFVKRFIFPVILSFKKTGAILEVSSTGIFKEAEHCPLIDTTANIKEKNIYIEPGHFLDDPGHETFSIKEFEVTTRITESLKVLCKSHSLKCTILQQKNIFEKMKELDSAEPKPDLIISIHIGKYNNPEDKPFRAMFPLGSENSEKLACVMGNKFRKDYVVLDAISVDMGKIRQDDYRAILSESVPSAILEIGNINNPDNFNQNSDINEIASIIISALKEYHSAVEPLTDSQTEVLQGAQEPEKPGAVNQGQIKAITR